MTTLIPDRGWYRPDDEVAVDLVPSPVEGGTIQVLHLDRVVREVAVEPGQQRVAIGPLPLGGYGIRFAGAATAVDVLEDGFDRPRYGFVVRLTDEVDEAAFARTARRLHLTASQLYDWAYRHSTLLPPERYYVDPLGQPRDLQVVDRVSRALDDSGVVPLGYSAVYAIGASEVGEWARSVLVRTDGEPYRLGEHFLVLVDPADPGWLGHYLEQLASVVERTAIRGFHLDQYGWPKFARRADGARVDLAASFSTLLHAVRDRLPSVPFVFNNVNDFPTAVTAGQPQNATYIEVWDPHSELADLGALASAARALRPEHPPILSAYLPCYGTDEESRADAAADLVMATAFSHGATHLLLGEDGAALTGPYYPEHHRLSAASLEHFVAWYDFAVRYGDLLFDPQAIDVTEHYTGGINEDVVLSAPDVEFATKARPGTVWTRVVRTGLGLVIHMIDLRDQTETRWDAGKHPVRPLGGVTLSLAPVDASATVHVAQPSEPDLVPIVSSGAGAAAQVNALSAGQAFTRFELPELRSWALVWVPAADL